MLVESACDLVSPDDQMTGGPDESDHSKTMTAHLLCVGDELLIGQVVNTNAAWLGRRLGDVGVRVERCEAVRDDAGAIDEALQHALSAGADVVIFTGGLGPTHDDLTVSAIAASLGLGLRFDAGAFDTAAEKIRARGREVTAGHRALGMVPEGFEPLPNPKGLAPGLWGKAAGGTTVVALPGVPYEMEAIAEAHVLPRLRAVAGEHAVLHHTFQTVGEGETALAKRIGDPAALPGAGGAALTLAFLPALGTVRVRITAHGEGESVGRALREVANHVRSALGPSVFSEDDLPLEAVVGRMLLERKLWIATGESCTGGAVAARLTSVAGASRYVRGGVVAYDNSAKSALLGVPEELLRDHGAVSEPVARAMAAGARRAMGADVGIAVTGVAGPGGGTPRKPVGTVWLAVDAPAGARAVRHQLTTEREINVALATMLALDLVRRSLRAA